MSFMIGSNINIANVRRSGGGGASYLLDTYPAKAAYSLRQLSSTATNTLRVRRASDNAELDIGFDAGWLDEAAIATHCGASIGYIAKWYDQSGNGYDNVQATAGSQPKIYDGASVYQLNSRPSAKQQNTNTFMVPSPNYGVAIPQPDTVFSVTSYSSGFEIPWGGNAGANEHRLYIYSGATQLRSGSPALAYSETPPAGQHQHTLLFNTTASAIRRDGVELVAGAGGSEESIGIHLFNFDSGTSAGDQVQEVIHFDSDMTANFSAIETDINTAFSIY